MKMKEAKLLIYYFTKKNDYIIIYFYSKILKVSNLFTYNLIHKYAIMIIKIKEQKSIFKKYYLNFLFKYLYYILIVIDVLEGSI